MKTPRRHIHFLAFILILLGVAVATVGLFSPREAHLKEPGDTQLGTPAPPTNLMATKSSSQITLSWQAGPAGEIDVPNNFVIYRTTGNNLNFTGVASYATVPYSQLSYADAGISPGVTYNYKVAAKNGTLESQNSNLASATAPEPAPTAPTNVAAVAQSYNQIQITWDAVAGATGYNVYRQSGGPAFTLLTSTGAPNFSDTGVSPNTSYSYYIIATNSGGDSPASTIVSATTPDQPSSPSSSSDTTAPQIYNVVVEPQTTTADLNWQTNELASSMIQYGKTPDYGDTVALGTTMSEQTRLSGLSAQTKYYYQIAATDSSGNHSEVTGNFTTLADQQPLLPPTNFQASPAAGKISLSWKNPTSNPAFRGVRLLRKTGAPSQTASDGDLLFAGNAESFSDTGVIPEVTYFYTLYSFDDQNATSAGALVSARLPSPSPTSTPSSSIPVNPTQCNMRAVDCSNPACSGQAVCKKPPTTPTTTSSRPVVPFPLTNIQFLAANRTVRLTPANAVVQGLPGRQLVVALPKTLLARTPKTITFTAGNLKTTLLLQNKTNTYETLINFPAEGSEKALLSIDYGSGALAESSFTIDSAELGTISSSSAQPSSDPIQISLFSESGKMIVPGDPVEHNPELLTTGKYGWIVPNGKYYILITQDQFTTTTATFVVEHNLINQSLIFTSPRPSIFSLPSSSTPLAHLTSLFVHDVVTPISAGLVMLGLLVQVSLFDIFALLRLLFLQPVLLIGARRRDAWGEVYNSLNKLPVDLAVVRLLDAKTHQILQTRVTGKSGRYFFTVGPGKYQLEVVKDHMQFPSQLLLKVKNDGRKTDLYHGESLLIKAQDPVITATIPLDPRVEEKTLARLHWERLGRVVQILLSLSGIGVTIYSLFLTPGVAYLWVLLVIHITVLMIFIRLAIPKHPQGWGKVNDKFSNRALGGTVAKLYNTQYNRLVDYALTDRDGRYFFLAGDSTYQIRFEKADYKVQTSREIDVRGKEEENVALNIGLEREDQT